MRKVKEGDIVVCINDTFATETDGTTYLTSGVCYDVKHIIDHIGSSHCSIYRVMNNNGVVSGYYSSRFISLSDYRKQKLERLKIISNG